MIPVFQEVNVASSTTTAAAAVNLSPVQNMINASIHLCYVHLLLRLSYRLSCLVGRCTPLQK